jgi:hypothetical protein
MDSCKTCKTASATILGTLGLVIGFMVIRSLPDLIRYVKISRM